MYFMDLGQYTNQRIYNTLTIFEIKHLREKEIEEFILFFLFFSTLGRAQLHFLEFVVIQVMLIFGSTNLVPQMSDREFLIRVSYMEIYNEEINDLLVVENQKLQIHESLEVA